MENYDRGLDDLQRPQATHFRRYALLQTICDDFPVFAMNNVWNDTVSAGLSQTRFTLSKLPPKSFNAAS